MKDKPAKSIVNIVVDRLTVMAVSFASLGSLLIWKGYHGDLLIGGAITCAGAIGAILASPRTPSTPQDVKVVNEPGKEGEQIPVVEDKKKGAP